MQECLSSPERPLKTALAKRSLGDKFELCIDDSSSDELHVSMNENQTSSFELGKFNDSKMNSPEKLFQPKCNKTQTIQPSVVKHGSSNCNSAENVSNNLTTFTCAVCGDEFHPQDLISCLRTNDKSHRNTDWQLTFFFCFFHHIPIEDIENKKVCKKDYMEWYNFFKLHAQEGLEKYAGVNENFGQMNVDNTEASSSHVSFTEVPTSGEITELANCDYLSTLVSLSKSSIITDKITCNLKTEDLFNLTSCSKFWRSREEIWKIICNRKLKVSEHLKSKSWYETYIYAFKKREGLQREIECDRMDTNQFIAYLTKSLAQHKTEGSELRKIMEGLKQEPKNSELLVYLAAKVIAATGLKNYSDVKKETLSDLEADDFRVGIEYFQVPFCDRLYDIAATVTTEELQQKLSSGAIIDKIFKCLHLLTIRTCLISKYNVTPMHKMLSHFFSSFHSRAIMTMTNKLGSSYSYSADCKENKEARKTLNENMEKLLNDIPSDVHFFSLDNLETTMKWLDMLKSKEKIIHFMTLMVQYAPDFYLKCKDFYPKPHEQSLKMTDYGSSDKNEEKIEEFMNAVFGYCENIINTIPEQMERYIDCLACDISMAEQADSGCQEKITLPSLDISKLPTRRLIKPDFPGNLTETENLKSDTVYLRVEQLCSTNLLDVKNLIDTLMDDYGLFKLKYLPSTLYQPPSPLMFISTISEKETHIFRNKWGLIKKSYDQLQHDTELTVTGTTNDILLSTASRLINKSDGIQTSTSILQQAVKQHPSETFLKLCLAELYRKQQCFSKAIPLYLEVLQEK